MPTEHRSREIHLTRRPQATPAPDDFEVVGIDLPPLDTNDVLVENLFLSVDPYMRGRMSDRESYVPPFRLGEPLEGGAVGRVAESSSEDLAVGDHVLHFYGWRERVVAPAAHFTRIDVSLAPAQRYLGILGMTGFTAFVGLLDIAGIRSGETVFVSGAAGAVGSAACQIARVKGCRVVASAGSEEKTTWLTEVARVDATINYRTTPDLAGRLRELCPDGIDVYFDNVGGDHLEAAIGVLNQHGRAALCGMIAQYNATEPPCAPRNLMLAVGKRLRLEGFLVGDHRDRQPEFVREMAGWLASGEVHAEETVVDGLERMPEAFLGLFEGDNLGKMLVRVA